jgi:hypothetical protein
MSTAHRRGRVTDAPGRGARTLPSPLLYLAENAEFIRYKKWKFSVSLDFWRFLQILERMTPIVASKIRASIVWPYHESLSDGEKKRPAGK